MNDLIKKWVRRAGLELVEYEEQPERRALVTVRMPGRTDPVLSTVVDLGKLEDSSQRAAESLLAYEFENISAALHADWQFQGLRAVEPDAELLKLGKPCHCGGKRIVAIDHKAHVYRCERDIEHVFPRVTAIAHDGLLAVLYAEDEL